MRYLFGLLVATNLAVGGWLYWQQALAPKHESVTEVELADGKRLQLLNEIPANELKMVPEKSAVAPASPAVIPTPPVDTGLSAASTEAPEPTTKPTEQPVIQTTSCLRITNIGNKKASAALSRKITNQNISVLDSGESFEERPTYWVYIPPLPSRAAAREIMAVLARKRVKDYLLVRSGEFENAVSLGLFSQKEGAEARLQEIRKLHLPSPAAQLRTKSSTYRSYWLLVKGNGPSEVASLKTLLQREKYTAEAAQCQP